MDFTDLMADARVEQDAFGERSFPRINMGHDADIAGTLQGIFAGHRFGLSATRFDVYATGGWTAG
jgi:hypothetical protein